MKGAPQTALWVAALAGSLVLHGAIGMALVAMPMPEARQDVATDITIETLAAGAAESLAVAKTVAPAVVATEVAATPSVVESATPADLTATPLTQTLPEKLAPASDPLALSATDDVVAPKPLAETPDAIEAVTGPVSSALPREAEAVAPVERDALEALGATTDPIVTPAEEAAQASQAVTDGADIAAAIEAEPSASAPIVEQAPLPGLVEQPLAVAPSAADMVAQSDTQALVAGIEPAIPEIASQAAEPDNSAAPIETEPSAITGIADQAPLGGIAEDPLTSPPSIVMAPTPTDALVPVDEQPRPDSAMAASPAGQEQAIAAEEPATDEQQLAMVVPDPPVIAPMETAPRQGLALTDFLKEHEGGECLLALPTTATTMETLSDSGEAGPALASLYEQTSGIPVRTETRTVSKAQCGALAFSRSLYQYPNFVLRLDLDSRIVASGETLAGRVSGLRKNSLTLFVVDDDGKATLVENFYGVTNTIKAFQAPVTLTSGPVASVQLLVAIASDGPLRTVATRPGTDAESLFQHMTDEIRNDNRSIHFGITSFTVR